MFYLGAFIQPPYSIYNNKYELQPFGYSRHFSTSYVPLPPSQYLNPNYPIVFYKDIDDTMVPNVLPNRYVITDSGLLYNRSTGNFTYGNESNCGYLRVTMGRQDQSRTSVSMHRLVGMAFCNNENLDVENLTINHINGNKKINYWDNLEWCSQRDNAIHALKNGLKRSGENLDFTIATNDQVKHVCEMLQDGYGYSPIMKYLRDNGVKGDLKNFIHNIKNKSTYGLISEGYNFTDSKPIKMNYGTVEFICKSLTNGITDYNYYSNYAYGKPINEISDIEKETLIAKIDDIKHRRIFKNIVNKYPDF